MKIYLKFATLSLLNMAFGHINYEILASKNINSDVAANACTGRVKLSALLPFYTKPDLVSFFNLAGNADSRACFFAVDENSFEVNAAVGFRQKKQENFVYGLACGVDVRNDYQVTATMYQLTASFDLAWQNTRYLVNGYVPLCKKYTKKQPKDGAIPKEESEFFANYGMDLSIQQKLTLGETEYPFWLKGEAFGYVDSNYFTNSNYNSNMGIKLGGIFEVNPNFDVQVRIKLSSVNTFDKEGKSNLSHANTIKFLVKYKNSIGALKFAQPETMYTVLQREDKGPLFVYNKK